MVAHWYPVAVTVGGMFSKDGMFEISHSPLFQKRLSLRLLPPIISKIGKVLLSGVTAVMSITSNCVSVELMVVVMFVSGLFRIALYICLIMSLRLLLSL